MCPRRKKCFCFLTKLGKKVCKTPGFRVYNAKIKAFNFKNPIILQLVIALLCTAVKVVRRGLLSC